MLTTDFIIQDQENIALESVFLSDENKNTLQQLVKEFRYSPQLATFGLHANHKILFYGASGCGKTTTAKAIAQLLKKPIFILNLSTLINSRIGETSKNLKAVFDKAQREKAVLFLDEFDQIGKSRSDDEKDVGEMRRLVNTILQLFDYFPKDCLLICATNHIDFIDFALVRRFQLKLEFDMPDDAELNRYYDSLLSTFPEKYHNICRKYAVSYAEAKDYTHTLLKKKIIQDIENEQVNNNFTNAKN
ncbi:MAG: ATP-binding protein [Capnocytophaga sp.]|nr:ATP-binding protein [Capnocytophaga sp.]